jgi:PHD and RING finger domain-containing protein 1
MNEDNDKDVTKKKKGTKKKKDANSEQRPGEREKVNSKENRGSAKKRGGRSTHTTEDGSEVLGRDVKDTQQTSPKNSNTESSTGPPDQPPVVPTVEDGDGAAESLPSTSSKPADSEPQSSNGQQAEGPACPICFAKFTTQEVGTTDTCNHNFCASCIQNWSKYVGTCPLDRQQFDSILVRKHVEGETISTIPVDSLRRKLTFCAVCGECDSAENMILCCECDFACHLTCVDPPLDPDSADELLCPSCMINNLVFLLEQIVGSYSEPF